MGTQAGWAGGNTAAAEERAFVCLTISWHATLYHDNNNNVLSRWLHDGSTRLPSVESTHMVHGALGSVCGGGGSLEVWLTGLPAPSRLAGKEQVSALVGYAAGTRIGPDGKVCYYYADPRVSIRARARTHAAADQAGLVHCVPMHMLHGQTRYACGASLSSQRSSSLMCLWPDRCVHGLCAAQTQYERLGHAEVVQLALSAPPSDTAAAEKEFRAFAETYFKQFKATPFGMSRSVSGGIPARLRACTRACNGTGGLCFSG